MDSFEELEYSRPTFLLIPVFCPNYNARRFTLDTPCLSCQRHNQARNPSLPLERFRCSKCRCFRPITDYPLGQDDFRAATCSIWDVRRRDEYREQKGGMAPDRDILQ
jgi:hypothetical protein